jgi:hypothetical protein
MSNPEPHYEPIFAGVPLFLTFVNEPPMEGYECQKRGYQPQGHQPKEGFSYMGFLLYTRSLSGQIPQPSC